MIIKIISMNVTRLKIEIIKKKLKKFYNKYINNNENNKK